MARREIAQRRFRWSARRSIIRSRTGCSSEPPLVKRSDLTSGAPHGARLNTTISLIRPFPDPGERRVATYKQNSILNQPPFHERHRFLNSRGSFPPRSRPGFDPLNLGLNSGGGPVGTKPCLLLAREREKEEQERVRCGSQ